MKYEFTDDQLIWEDRILHRIIATKQVSPSIPRGTYGGWIEKENNLSQDGLCWIDRNSKVYENATVEGDAKIEASCILGCAVVDGRSNIVQSRIADRTRVHSSYIQKHTIVYDKAIITDSCIRESNIGGNANINKSYITESTITGNSIIYDASINTSFMNHSGKHYNINIKNGSINKAKDILTIGNLLLFGGSLTAYRTKEGIQICSELFAGDIDDKTPLKKLTPKGKETYLTVIEFIQTYMQDHANRRINKLLI